MSIDLDWGDAEQRFAVMHFRGNWTGDDLIHRIAQLYKMGAEATYGMELLVDMRNSLTPPPNLLTLIGSILIRPLPQNIHQVVVISNTAFWNRMFSVIHKTHPNRIRVPIVFVASVDEGYAALECFKGMV